MSRGTTGRAAAALAALLLLAGSPTQAVSLYRLRGGVAGSGGTPVAGGGTALTGTVGQPGVGRSHNAISFSACSGFWCFGGAQVVAVGGDDGGGPGASALPTELSLGPPVPTPTRGDVRFTLALPHDAAVTLTVFDVAGRSVGGAVTERLKAGYHQLHWAAPAANAGVYFGVLRVDGATSLERRIVLVR